MNRPGNRPQSKAENKQATKSIDEDVHYKILRLLEETSTKPQRELSKDLGISLGAVNYCVKALAQKGEVKINNFRASKNNLRYAYILTPRGVESKARLTAGFLRRKMAEYEALREEIERLRDELDIEFGGDVIARDG